MRTGLLAKKIGTSRVYTNEGNFVSVTLLEVKDCFVLSHKTKDKDGYNALQLGIGKAKEKNVAKPQREFFKKIGISPSVEISEFRIEENSFIDVGSSLSVNHFQENQFVDISGISIGKWFAGVVKRHNFSTLDATHGVSLTHRSHGSTGNRQDPGRVFKGKKMAGHLGNKDVTVQNIKILNIDEENNLIIVKGAVPGHKGSFVKIKDSIKKRPSESQEKAGVVNKK